MKIKNIDDYREILENENLLLHAEGFGGEACKRTIRERGHFLSAKAETLRENILLML